MAKRPPSAEPPAGFEKALQELEGIVQAMEQNPMGLEDSLTSYERGMQLLKYCQEQLSSAEQKVRILENGALRDFAPDDEDSDDS